jgi:MFS family permease
VRIAAVAWLLTAVYYFYQYALRSAPAVMMLQLSEAFDLGPLGVASIVGLFYYGYSPFSLVAGAAMDRLGPRRLLPMAAAVVGLGALLFSTGSSEAASAGRFLQGAGGVFALVGAIYIATTSFPPSRAATLIGATQMFGMAGGSAGQFVVGPLIGRGLSWQGFWLGMGVLGLAIGVVLFFLLPKDERKAVPEGGLKRAMEPFGVVFRNPQSILCGLIAGLLFIPTTIFDMIWGVRFLQEARGFEYADAVLRSSTVPFGWILGCPLLGFLSDRIGRRKPVILGGALVLLGCLALILYGPADLFPPYSVGLVAGLASGRRCSRTPSSRKRTRGSSPAPRPVSSIFSTSRSARSWVPSSDGCFSASPRVLRRFRPSITRPRSRRFSTGSPSRSSSSFC